MSNVISTAEQLNLSDEELLRRAVKNARAYFYGSRIKHPRWVAVMDLFGVGATVANGLCHRFKLDPDEMVHK